jgi:hypothetical protein
LRRVIVESPYSSGTVISIPAVIERNVRYLRACLRDCVLSGDTPYASHGLLTQEGVLRDEIPDERSLGIRAGFAWRPGTHATLFYTDLGWSGGMIYGRQDAEALRLRQPDHAIEEHTLGGEWAMCLFDEQCCQPRTPHRSHAYACPMWRPT